ncbi:MAG: hypothetical protein P4L87_21085 [Formivibrio sp.]|nr:hypothetical protein [Formivibrio sp.]
MIERVKQLTSEFNLYSLVDCRLLDEGNIPILHTWLSQDIAP